MNIDAAAEAFLLAEVARSRSVQRALAASGVRAAAGNPELAGLVRRDQDNRKRIAALYSVLSDALSRPSDQHNSKTLASLRSAIGKLEGALLALRREIEARFPAYAELINPKPVTIEGARGALRAGESLISIYVGGERTYIWAVSNRGAVKFASVELGREQLSEQVALLRGALDSNAEVLGDIPEKAYPSEPGLTTCWVCGCHRQDVRLMFCHAQPLERRPPDVPRRLRGALSR